MTALLNISIPMEPVPKTRPRFAVDRNYKREIRVYSDQGKAKDTFAWTVRCLAPHVRMQPKNVALAINLVFNTTSKSVDIDNLVKFVLDAGNGFLWEDDRQIEKLVARLNRVKQDPSVDILLEREGESQ